MFCGNFVRYQFDVVDVLSINGGIGSIYPAEALR